MFLLFKSQQSTMRFILQVFKKTYVQKVLKKSICWHNTVFLLFEIRSLWIEASTICFTSILILTWNFVIKVTKPVCFKDLIISSCTYLTKVEPISLYKVSDKLPVCLDLTLLPKGTQPSLDNTDYKKVSPSLGQNSATWLCLHIRSSFALCDT